MNRTEFGFVRTFSTSLEDVECCKAMSGYLIPADLQRIADFLGIDPYQLARAHLLASPGALVLYNGQKTRLPTLVPDRDEVGNCKWLQNDRCAIHQVAPYACAFFDYGMSMLEGDKRSRAGMQVLIDIWINHDDPMHYADLWHILNMTGRKTYGPEEGRRRIANARTPEVQDGSC